MNEADHSEASRAMVKNGKNQISTLSLAFMTYSTQEQLYLYVYIQTYCAKRIQIMGFSARWVMTLPGLACAGQHFEGTASQFSGHTLGNIHHDLLSHLDLAMCSTKIMSVSVYEGALSSRSGCPTRDPTGSYVTRGDNYQLYICTTQITQFRQSDTPLTCAAREPAHNKGSGLLTKRLITPGLHVHQ